MENKQAGVWQSVLRKMKDGNEFDDKFNPNTLEFNYAFQMGFKAAQQPIPVNQDEGYVNPEYKDLFEKRLDYSNYEQLAEDVWLFLTDDSRPAKASIKKEALINEVKTMIESAVLFRLKDFEEVQKDHARLVRELDVLINGENGAAKQASLCDIVAQLKSSPSPTPVQEGGFDYELAKEAIDIIEGLVYFSQIHEVKGVVLPKGNHESFWKRGQQFLWNKCRIIESEYFPKEPAQPKAVQEGLREAPHNENCQCSICMIKKTITKSTKREDEKENQGN